MGGVLNKSIAGGFDDLFNWAGNLLDDFGKDIVGDPEGDAARAARDAERRAKKRLQGAKKEAAAADSTANEKARAERESRLRKASGTSLKTTPVGLTTAFPGTPKTLLGE